MILDLPPHIEQAIIAKAQQQGLTVNELLAKDYAGVNDDDIWLELDKHGLNADSMDINADEARHLMQILDNPPPPNPKARALLFGDS
ncbi:hypothetical protein LU293_01650 [Moraxella nasovis]|uniref:hypothetical protein n=1 Tax=Moraxella nasovis TaxID=2904121 RepID=UPI001F60F6FA|nr:hypothetical protein [Moraxella nasovis]UNU73642.1 hypothetical protein LU293_01650 [Moraxella nasovis]